MSKYWITPEGKYIVGYGADIAPQNATEVQGPPQDHVGSWPPSDTDIWDGTQWNADPVATAADARSQRDTLLAATDLYALVDNTLTTAMTEYRQALRDVPGQNGFPNEVTWPTEPN